MSHQSLVKYDGFDGILSFEDATSIAAFHFSIVNPLAKYYVTWALDHLSQETDFSINPNLNLSETEERRLFRALYRFQLFCNLFGAGRYLSPGHLRLNMDAVDILDMFICIFEPWEVEEILCVYTFAKFKYNQIFNDISVGMSMRRIPSSMGSGLQLRRGHLILETVVSIVPASLLYF